MLEAVVLSMAYGIVIYGLMFVLWGILALVGERLLGLLLVFRPEPKPHPGYRTWRQRYWSPLDWFKGGTS